MIFYIIYISKSKKLMSDPELLALLGQARKGNGKRRITGILLYIQGRFLNRVKDDSDGETEGRFIQVLEGNEAEVMSVFDRISSDGRHQDIMVLKEAEISQRNFDAWDMGFSSMDLDAYKEIPGFLPLDDLFLEERNLHHSNLPLDFLKSFYKMSKGKS